MAQPKRLKNFSWPRPEANKMLPKRVQREESVIGEIEMTSVGINRYCSKNFQFWRAKLSRES